MHWIVAEYIRASRLTRQLERRTKFHSVPNQGSIKRDINITAEKGTNLKANKIIDIYSKSHNVHIHSGKNIDVNSSGGKIKLNKTGANVNDKAVNINGKLVKINRYRR